MFINILIKTKTFVFVVVNEFVSFTVQYMYVANFRVFRILLYTLSSNITVSRNSYYSKFVAITTLSKKFSSPFYISGNTRLLYYIHTLHYNPSVRIIIRTIDVFFENLFMAIFIYSQRFCQKSTERKSPKKYFSYSVLMSGLGLEPCLFV